MKNALTLSGLPWGMIPRVCRLLYGQGSFDKV